MKSLKKTLGGRLQIITKFAKKEKKMLYMFLYISITLISKFRLRLSKKIGIS